MAANPYRLRILIDQALQEQGLTTASVISCNATYVSLSLANQGMGVAIYEPVTSAGRPRIDLVSIPISFAVPLERYHGERAAVVTNCFRYYCCNKNCAGYHSRRSLKRFWT